MVTEIQATLVWKVLVCENFGITFGKVIFKNDVIARISSPSIVLVLLEYFKLMFHSHVSISIIHLHLIQNQVQSQKNSQDCIFYLIFPSPPPIVVLSWLCLVSWVFGLQFG